jgi:uncharacterized protein YkwD
MGRRWLFGGFAALLFACSSSAPARTPVSPTPVAPSVKLELPAGAAMYDSKPLPSPAVGSSDAQDVERALLDVAKSKGIDLAGDGRLAQLGDFILSAFRANGHPPASASIDTCAHRLGLIEPVPLFMIFGRGPDGSWASALKDLLTGVPHGSTYNRYGIAVTKQKVERLAVAVLSSVSVEIEPVRRHATPGGAITLRGNLRDRYRDAAVEVTRPDGTVDHVAEASGAGFDVGVPFPAKGVHRVEILARGPYGAEVLANFPIFAAVAEPSVVNEAALAGAPAVPRDARAVENRLLALLNEARAVAGVPPLTAHPGLAEVAELHSRDMVESGFFGHDSPTFGDPATRVHRKGLAFVIIAENVGRGSTAEEVNTMLLDSPGHRANALDPNLTHVGIGVVLDTRQGNAEIVATEDFGGVARSIDVGAAPAEVLRAINAERARVGAAALVVDPLLGKAASRGAARFFGDPASTQQQVVSSVNEELVRPVNGSSPISKRMRAAQSFLFAVISVDRTPKMDKMVDPSARYVGIGVAQGSRPDTGPSTIAIVVVLGWPR